MILTALDKAEGLIEVKQTTGKDVFSFFHKVPDKKKQSEKVRKKASFSTCKLATEAP